MRLGKYALDALDALDALTTMIALAPPLNVPITFIAMRQA